MILLSGHSLNAEKMIADEALSLSLKERDSTADWTPDSMSGITVNSWLCGNGGPGDGIVWRVRSIEQDYGEHTPSVKLDHIISTLRDTIMFGEITPEMMGGSDGTCTAQQAVSYILGRQSDWTLGSFSYGSVTGPYKFDGDDLFSALEKVTNTLDDAWWSYDLTVYPFELNITEKPSGVACEMRADRNLTSLTKTIDRTGMYTRFYPIGKDDLHISGNYVSLNESTYGTVSKVEVDQSLETEGELIAWANERLSKHAEPKVTVTADGLEMAEATGESLDSLQLGRICRIPLPEFDTTIEERIVELEYRDAVFEPDVVRITMANAQEDIARIIADEILNGAGPSGRGGRGGARQAGEDHAWFEDTDTHVAMCAEGIVGIDPETGEPDWARLSQIIVDGEGIHQRVTVMHEDLVEAQASIEINENAIQAEVMRANSEEGILRSEILQTATMIMSSVSANNSAIYSEVVQTASMIRSEVSNSLSDFYTMIMQTASEIVIRTGENTKTYRQDTAPTGTVDDPLVDGDLWFNSAGKFVWSDLADDHWLDDTATNWQTLKTAEISRYNGTTNQWEKVVDEKAILQDTRYQQNKEHIQLVAGRVDATDGKVESYRAEFEVKADQITSSVTEQVNGINSRITQTATQIRSEVGSAKSDIYSEILQTATMIYSHVANETEGLHSEIVQTASQIRIEVRNTKSDMYSRITQTAEQISLKVSKGEIISSINQSAEQIQISAGKIDLDGYVTASQLNTQKARIDNLISGATTLSSVTASNAYLGGSGGGTVRIYGQTVRIYQVKDTNGTTRNVFGYS